MLDTILSVVPFVFLFMILCLVLDSMGIRNMKEEYALSSDTGKRVVRVLAMTIGVCAIAGIIANASSGLVALPFLLGSLALYGMVVLKYADIVSRWFGSRRQQFARIARNSRNSVNVTETD